MISIRNVKKTYKDGTHAINGISLDIEDGEFVYVVGPTGSGKSTLIKLLDAEEKPDEGEVNVQGINVGKLKNRKVPLYRRLIGVVFQDYKLLNPKTVFENVAFALEVVDKPKKELRERVREVLKLVDLADKASSFPNKISGGQRQRTAIARAIANSPKVLIADEPTGNLDPDTSDEIIKLLEKINKEEGTTILVVTHDKEIVKNHPKRIIRLEAGIISGDIPESESTYRFSAMMTKKRPRLDVDDRTLEKLVDDEIIEKRNTEEISLEEIEKKLKEQAEEDLNKRQEEEKIEIKENTQNLDFGVSEGEKNV